MKKLVLLFVGALLCNSCFLIQQGRIADGMCRPKRPNFKLLKTPFKETDKLVFDKTYLGKSITSFALKFYSDGRLIFFTSQDGFTIKPSDTFNKNWENAPNIGYWRVEDNKIKVEYFLCGDSGFYKREQGEIKGDSIVFIRLYFLLLRESLFVKDIMFCLICHLSSETLQVYSYCKSVTKIFFKACGEKIGDLRKICARLTEIFFEADGEKFGGLRKNSYLWI